MVLLPPSRIRLEGPPDVVNEVAEQVRAAKSELLRVLAQEQPSPCIPADELPTTFEILSGFPQVTGPPPPKRVIGGTLEEWRRTAGQILRGEFEGADRGLRESLVIGLRGWDDRTCRKALALLRMGEK